MIVELHPDVYKQLRQLSASVFKPVLAKILALQVDARPIDVKKLAGSAGSEWRVRVGEYRIVYQIDDSAGVATVMKVGHRREVYQ